MFDFADQVVMITGAAGNLGHATALAFRRGGARLALANRSYNRLEETFADLSTANDVLFLAGDLTDPGAVEGLARETIEAFGRIDVLVNVAGVANGTRTFARLARGWPAARRVLVNVSSGAARTPYEGWAVYGATKAAVDQYTRTVAVEEPGLLCHAVAPGVVETALQEQVRALDEATFPAVERFRRIRAEGRANSPAWVADHLAGILLGSLTPDEVLYRVPDEHP